MITISQGQTCYDIKVKQDNTVKEVLHVLRDAGILSFNELTEQVYSLRKKRTININKTFRQAGIYQGDSIRVNE